MPTNQHRSALFIGFLNIGFGNVSTSSLNGAASSGFSVNWLSCAWNPSESKTVSAVKIFASAVGGTLAATDLVCDVYSDNAGVGPNASLATTSTVTATPTGAAWVEFTGFSLALTAGTQYWFVFRNANAAPTVNFVTYRFGSNSSFIVGGSSESNASWGSLAFKSSTNSGGSWSAVSNAYSCGVRVQYSDGTYDGLPISNVATLAAASATFGKQAVGVQFVTPLNAILNIRGAQMMFTRTGAPGLGVFKLYNGSTLLGTSSSLPNANVTTGRMFTMMFPSTIVVQPGTTLNLVLADLTTADTSAKAYQQQTYTVDNDANSFSLMPFEGTLRLTTTTDYTVGSPTFVTDQTQIVPFSLILDSTGEFAGSTVAGVSLF